MMLAGLVRRLSTVGAVSGGWRKAAALLLISGCAVVPCLFTTQTSDVFYLPKLVGLWVLLAAVIWLLAVSNLTEEGISSFRWIGVVDVPVLAFVLLNLLALALSTDRHQSLFGERLQHQGVLTILLYVGFFYLARVLITDRQQIFRLFVAITIGATAVASYAIIQKLGLDPIWKGYLPSGRVFSTIGQPNALAAYLVLAIPTTAALAIEQRRFWRVATVTSLALIIGALLLTYSRGGYLGLALAVAVFIVGLREKIKMNLATLGAYVGAALIALVLTLSLIAPARAAVTRAWHRSESVSAVSGDESIGNHIDLWRVAIHIVARHPLFGTGPETFPEVFPGSSRTVLPAATVSYFEQFRVESPHDQVLAVASGAGIPAAIAYISALAGIVYVLWRATTRGRDGAVRLALVAVMAAALAHVVTDAFMSAEITGSWMFWILVGAGVGVASGQTDGSEEATTGDGPDGHHLAVEHP
jgi:putative inorganic carbon (HCO3(-)) transporter